MQIELVDINTIHEDPANVRMHDERNLETIKASLTRFGQQKPIVVDGSGIVRAGNGTLAAARSLGWEEISVVRTDLVSIEAAAYAIADNRSAEVGSTWDNESLAKILGELAQEEKLEGTGFSNEDLAEMMAGLAMEDAMEADEGVAPLPPDKPTTQIGDVWVIGKHRLMCGDSSAIMDVSTLVGSAPIHLLNTDPPYGISNEPRSNNAHAAGLTTHADVKGVVTKMRAKDRGLKNDDTIDFKAAIGQWFANAAEVMSPGASFYIWGGYSNVASYPEALEHAGFKWSQMIVWDKEHPVMGRKDFMGSYELCFYGWKEGASHNWYGPTNARDLWQVKKMHHTEMVHLTEKPVELALRSISFSSKASENVLDLFGGSGSTLIACQQSLRNAFVMEVDPAYCDVIVMRSKEQLKLDAFLESTGESFEDVRMNRAEKTV